MTQKSMMDLLPKGTKKNFVILTNIAEGGGINGVAYQTFDANYKFDGQSMETQIMEYFVDCVKLRVTERGNCHYKDGTSDYYIPYENIVAIRIR